MRAITLLLLSFVPAPASAAPPPNTWTKTAAVVEGRRRDVPLGYDPASRRFLVLGGRSHWADYKTPRSYDVLSFDPSGRWKNELPNPAWGPDFGSVKAPPWKSEYWSLVDSDGNARPNWTVYGTFSLGQKYGYDPNTKAFYFYAGGSTFRYDPAKREWKDLAPPTHPEKELGGILLWSSMCYDAGAQRFVLFGGGNVQSPRGDPGTWTYSPAENKWERVKADKQLSPRANARLVYDPVNKKVVLFGGDRLDQLQTDLWVFDSGKGSWEERKPPDSLSPSPRAGHAMFWLPKAKKVLLLGGYTYASTTDYVAPLYKPLPMEAWTLDLAKMEWHCVGHWVKNAPIGPANFFQSAAVDDNDNVLVLDRDNRAWTIAIDTDVVDPLRTTRTTLFGNRWGPGRFTAEGNSGTTLRRTGSHDPNWYREGIPLADPVKVATELKELPANRWTIRPTPKRPLFNVDWGSAAFDTENDRIIRFSGGHSAYSGTAPQIYDIKTDRYSIPFAPEYPIEFVYSNDQVKGEWSFSGNPWMTGHTYKSTGYDGNLKCLVFAPHDYTYFFDAKDGRWSRSPGKNPYRSDFYNVTVRSTPDGAVVWGDARAGGKPGLWRLDAASRSWEPLRLEGELPAKSPDHHGLAYDSKRKRMLFFSDIGAKGGNVAAYDLATDNSKWLDPAGRASAKVPCRETIYLPDADLVLIGSRVKSDSGDWHWLAYDCAANAWIAVELTGDDPIGKARAFNNSMGLMFDPARKLVWAVGQHNHVHVLRFDAKSAKRIALK
ncbi:MAG TPA: kelch repeat-containing protein [Urbifossiella sp.]|nr:kelch repeat-containing protein [Urbifossiella sp.]